jgi:choline dehydrogenase-like flavoprotein
MRPDDFTVCLDGQHESWPIGFHELRSHYLQVWLDLGLNEREYRDHVESDDHLAGALPGFATRHSYAIAVQKRNFAKLWGARFAAAANIAIEHSTSVIGFETESDGAERRISGVITSHAAGRASTIRADHFVIAAGALEATRLVLELQESHPSGAKLAGVGLQDHLSVPIADVRILDKELFGAAWSPEVSQNGIVFRRLEATTELQRRLGVPSSFLHVTYGPAAKLPAELHELAQKVQLRDPIKAGKAALRASRHAAGVASMSLAYLLRRRIEWPADTPMSLLLDVEQLPDLRNRVSLGAPGFPGRRRSLAIRWAARETDIAAALKIAGHVFENWRSAQGAMVLEITPHSPEQIRTTLQREGSSFDVFHPSGTTRMGTSPLAGVVDRDCRVFGFRNLYIASTSVFPRAGSANPTYTLLALGSRLADHLSRYSSARA